ncbi:hypothetical protein FA95DRAFT_1463846, partial [Auriscalpium vulgare]
PVPTTPTTSVHIAPPPFSSLVRPKARIGDLSPYILLQIVHQAFPQTPDVDRGRLQRQRRTLQWLSTSLRLVNRAFYIACMHVLRSTYLPAYASLVRPPYTSDPFPLTSQPSPAPSSPTTSSSTPQTHGPLQRETTVLDLFIALRVREDVWADESDLHLGNEEAWRDLFDLMQPRARAEDLIRAAGDRYGLFFGPGSSVSARSEKKKVDFSLVSVTFSPRRVGLALTLPGGRRRTVVEVDRTRDEKLEVAAKRLAVGLRDWLA